MSILPIQEGSGVKGFQGLQGLIGTPEDTLKDVFTSIRREKSKVEIPDLEGLGFNQDQVQSLRAMVYGESANQPAEVQKMVAQSAINRLLSGRDKEFGGTIDDVLNKGYYAVSNRNLPYRQAVTNGFPDDISLKAWMQVKDVVKNIIDKKDYGNAQFYFTPDEITNLKKRGSKAFNFDLVKPQGTVGPYETFSY